MSSTNFIVKELLLLPVDGDGDSGKIHGMAENFFVVYGDTFGKRVRLLRQDRKWSQMDLAQKLNSEGVKINNTWISQLENSDKTPSADVVIAMAKAFETTTDFLFLLTNDPRIPSEQEPDFYSPEADEAAKIIDGMGSTEWRTMALEEVKRIGAECEDTKRLHIEMLEGLRRIEEEAGPIARAIAEDLLISRLDKIAARSVRRGMFSKLGNDSVKLGV